MSGYIAPQQPIQPQPPLQPVYQEEKGLTVFGIVGVVFGALGFVLSFIPIINNIAAIFGFIGVILAIVALVGTFRGKKRGKALAIVAAVLSVLAIVITLAMQSAASKAIDEATGVSSSQSSAKGSAKNQPKGDQDMEGDIVGYQNKNITNQKVITEESDQFTYRSWLKVKSVESALGYTSVLLDLDNVIYPKTEEDRWEKIVKDFSAKLATYWQPFSGFDGTTASECDSRIRTFLNSRYEDEREDNTITLKTTGTDAAAYYVLRTHNETVRKVTGGTAEKLEDSAWLIRAEQSEVTITLGSADQRYYYEKGAKNK